MPYKTMFRYIVGLLFINLPGFSAFADDYKSECEKIEIQNVAVAYCIHSPTLTQSSDTLLYHLHGGGGSESSWADRWYYTEQIRQEWKSTGIQLPTVVSISFGPLWLLAQKNSSPYSGLIEIFEFALIPKIESKLPKFKVRAVFGESMGGFNTAQLALQTSLFSKAAILCAPMSEVSIFASQEELHSHAKMSSAWQYYKDSDPEKVLNHVDRIVDLAKTFYPNENDWKKANPIQLARSPISSELPALYISAGFYDVYALFEGNEIFAQELKNRGHNVDWRPQWGGHCALDIQSLSKFLVQ